MATKKLTPVKREDEKSKYQTIESEPADIRNNLQKLVAHSQNMDYNLWMMMQMIRQIGIANGYTFTELKDVDTGSLEERE